MGICSFVCRISSSTGCCECAINGLYEECTEGKCSLNCLNDDEEERAEADWYYENYVKPQEEQE